MLTGKGFLRKIINLSILRSVTPSDELWYHQAKFPECNLLVLVWTDKVYVDAGVVSIREEYVLLNCSVGVYTIAVEKWTVGDTRDKEDLYSELD